MSAKKPIRKVKGLSEKLVNMQVSLAKKKECQAKALKLVEMLMDNPVNRDIFIESCQHINQTYYKDAVEERALLMLCGYPLCCNKLKQISAQKYHISLKYNKVFDIGERKHFCSNCCFKASKYLEMQLPSCPLWLLDEKCPVTVILFEQDEKSEDLGEEIHFEDQDIKQELKNFIESQDLSRSNQSDKALPDNTSVRAESAVDVSSLNKLSKAASEVSFDEPTDSSPLDCSSWESVSNSNVLKFNAQQKVGPLKPKSPNIPKAAGTSNQSVEDCLKEWFTLDTLRFLLGSEKYKLAVESKGYCLEELTKSLRLKESCDREAFAIRYKSLCSKLDMQEKEDSDLDSELTENEQHKIEEQRKKKLPSFEQLAKEMERNRLNVEAFYQGKMEVLRETGHSDANLTAETQAPSLQRNDDDRQQELSLPLIDCHAQNALRRRIVLDKLNRASATFLQTLNLSTREIASEMRQLVHTFNLQAHNITFKPAEWMLVILILINLLASKDDRLQETLQNETSHKCMAILLQSFLKDTNYLKRVSDWLMDVEYLIQKNEH